MFGGRFCLLLRPICKKELEEGALCHFGKLLIGGGWIKKETRWLLLPLVTSIFKTLAAAIQSSVHVPATCIASPATTSDLRRLPWGTTRPSFASPVLPRKTITPTVFFFSLSDFLCTDRSLFSGGLHSYFRRVPTVFHSPPFVLIAVLTATEWRYRRQLLISSSLDRRPPEGLPTGCPLLLPVSTPPPCLLLDWGVLRNWF